MDVDVSDRSTEVALSRPVVVPLGFGVYLAAARLASWWTVEPGSTQPLWIASGLAIGLALGVSRPNRPFVVAAALLGQLVDSVVFSSADAADAAGETAAIAAELVGGVAIMATLFSRRVPWGRVVTTFMAFLSCLALGAAGALVHLAWFGADDAWFALWSRTLGHGLGMGAAGAILLLSRGPGSWLLDADPRHGRVEFVAAVGTVAALAVGAFATDGQLTYLVVAALLWTAVRFGPRVAMPLGFLVIVYACARAAAGAGPFGSGSTADLVNLHAFDTTVLFTTALVSRYARGIDRERRRNLALLTAMPDTVTVATISASRDHVEPLTGQPLPDEALDALLERIRTTVADQPAGGRATAAIDEIGPGDDRRFIESRSVRVDRSHVLTVSRDISEQMRLVQQLQEAQARWQRLATTAYEGFMEFDGTGRLVYVTDRMAEMLGTDCDSLLGRDVRSIIDPADWPALEHQALDVLRGNRVTFETRYRRLDGAVGWAIVSSEPVIDADGAFAGAITFAADTSDFHAEREGRALAEMKLATVEQRERARIARGLHDGPLQTLVAISYQLNAITRGADPVTAAARLEAMALEATKRLRGSLEDLVPPALGEQQLHAALLSAAERFDGPDSPRLTIDRSTVSAIPIEIAGTIYQVGREAIVNAILHSGASHIDVSIGETPREFTIEITDDGRGFDQDLLVRADGHFGLQAMRERVAEAGGQIHVTSGDGAGTAIAASFAKMQVPAFAEPRAGEPGR